MWTTCSTAAHLLFLPSHPDTVRQQQLVLFCFPILFSRAPHQPDFPSAPVSYLFNHPGPVSWAPPQSALPPHLQCISLISPALHLIPSLISLYLGPVFCSVICSVSVILLSSVPRLAVPRVTLILNTFPPALFLPAIYCIWVQLLCFSVTFTVPQ